MLKDYLNKSDTERLRQFINTLSTTNRTPEYYVNWKKVENNTKLYELELNTLNFLLGKNNIKELARELFKEQPKLLAAIPSLIASREKKLEVLIVDDMDFSIESLDFKNPNIEKIDEYIKFIDESGLFDFMQSSLNSNLVDYVYGVETGLDTNARKNRSGTTMENIVFHFAEESISSQNNRFELIEQASAPTIKSKWKIIVPVDKSTRRFDFAIFDKIDDHLYLIETNYYGSGGSKLKSVAGEFTELSSFLSSNDKITFIWISDGQGWHTAHIPLSEAFAKIDYIFNLDMLKNKYLYELLLNIHLK